MAVSLGPSGLALDNYTLPNNSLSIVNQMRYTENNGKITINTGGWQNIGLNQAITPISTSSIILIMISFSRASTDRHDLDYMAGLRVMRNGSTHTNLNGIQAGSRDRVMGAIMGMAFNDDHNPGPWSYTGIDNPGTTSSITYNVQAAIQSTAHALHLNGTINNADTGNIYHARGKCHMTLMEILY